MVSVNIPSIDCLCICAKKKYFILEFSSIGNVDSVILIDDNVNVCSRPVQPISTNDDEDVIFVNETRREQRVTATIDLCASDTDTPYRKRNTEKSSDAVASCSNQYKSPTKTGNCCTESASRMESEDVSSSPSSVKVQCPICLEKFPLSQIFSTLCGHGFCEPCIKNSIKSRKKCPTCNANVNLKQIHRLFLQ